ncbi:hypothetical protein [Frankia sp. R82]|uniref:hypothetical protein n=1 Tax=Frankia sp. R82 TaxID=2950553 RepID=UPI002043A42A|nr:hypothetical protein [Frankia sp. R82]MCM3883558.1 hypothetical protein [Frankia sp. R82]
MRTPLHACLRIRTRLRRSSRSPRDAGEATELAAIMIGVFALLLLFLMMGVRWVTAEAAQAASQRALEVAQAPGATAPAVDAVARRITAGVLLVSGTDVRIGGQDDLVSVTVTAHSPLGGAVSSTATGPRIRFVPQQRSGLR